MTLEYNPTIETVVEIAKLYTWYKLKWQNDEYGDRGIFCMDYVAANHELLDWANEFEARIGDTYDWSSPGFDYIMLLDDFVTKKICDSVGVPEEKRPKQNTDIDFDKPGRWL